MTRRLDSVKKKMLADREVRTAMPLWTKNSLSRAN